jgi:hypothetical protein
MAIKTSPGAGGWSPSTAYWLDSLSAKTMPEF